MEGGGDDKDQIAQDDVAEGADGSKLLAMWRQRLSEGRGWKMQEGHSEEARQGGGADVVETDVMNSAMIFLMIFQ